MVSSVVFPCLLRSLKLDAIWKTELFTPEVAKAGAACSRSPSRFTVLALIAVSNDKTSLPIPQSNLYDRSVGSSGEGPVVGSAVGTQLGTAVGTSIGFEVGGLDGLVVGITEGFMVGLAEGIALGIAMGNDVGSALGSAVGSAVGSSVGWNVWGAVDDCAATSKHAITRRNRIHIDNMILHADVLHSQQQLSAFD